jgi:phage terminase large subunit-like protein
VAKRTRSQRTADRDPGISPEVAWYLSERGYTTPECAPAIRTPEPRDVPGAFFDPGRVDKVIAALKCLRHTQGKWAGRPLAPDAWQVAYVIAPIFGWVKPSEDEPDRTVRIVRDAYIEVSRKNGKTTLASGLALVLAFADGEHGAQVVAVAGSEKQARFCFDPAKKLATASPQLKAAGVKPLRSRIIQPDTDSYFEVAAAVGDLLHGANIHGAVVDELHVHKSPDVIDAVESGTGAREQPLIITITTADDGRTDSVYAHKRAYVEKLARGTIRNPSQFAVVFAADAEDAEGDRPFLEATWRKANPGYGVSPTRAFMKEAAAKAQDNPVERARFLRLHLGLRTKQETKYIDLPVWDRNAGLVDRNALRGRECYGGLDLAATSDLSAFCLVFPDADGGYDALWRVWTPEANMPRLNERTANAAEEWVRQGWLAVTPGEVMDYDFIRSAINKDREDFSVREIAYDPWNATQLVNDLVDDAAPMVTMRQGFVSMSPPLKELSRLLRQGTAKKPLLRHGGNPVMRWMVDNLAVATDASDNVKPDKKHSGDKIDGVPALVMALDRARNRAPVRRSAYEDDEDGGLLVV